MQIYHTHTHLQINKMKIKMLTPYHFTLVRNALLQNLFTNVYLLALTEENPFLCTKIFFLKYQSYLFRHLYFQIIWNFINISVKKIVHIGNTYFSYTFHFFEEVTFLCKEIPKQSFAEFYYKLPSGYLWDYLQNPFHRHAVRLFFPRAVR